MSKTQSKRKHESDDDTDTEGEDDVVDRRAPEKKSKGWFSFLFNINPFATSSRSSAQLSHSTSEDDNASSIEETNASHDYLPNSPSKSTSSGRQVPSAPIHEDGAYHPSVPIREDDTHDSSASDVSTTPPLSMPSLASLPLPLLPLLSSSPSSLSSSSSSSSSIPRYPTSSSVSSSSSSLSSSYLSSHCSTLPSRVTDEAVKTILMVGKSGAGKSSVGNLLLAREAFESKLSAVHYLTVCARSPFLFFISFGISFLPFVFCFCARVRRTRVLGGGGGGPNFQKII
jgi:hypothetical protein